MTSSLVQNLCKLAQSLFANFKHSSAENFDETLLSKFKSLFGQLTLKELHLTPHDLSLNTTTRSPSYYAAPVSYVHVFENDTFSLTVFGLRLKSSKIPLHDHPGMHGFIKCIHGTVSIKSYTLLQDSEFLIPDSIKSKVKKNGHSNIVPAIYVGEDILSSESSQVCSVTPQVNLHEIKPATNQLAVIADVISPPYTSQTDSFFYIILDTLHEPKLNKFITWLYRTPDSGVGSNEFYCDDIRYKGPRIRLT